MKKDLFYIMVIIVLTIMLLMVFGGNTKLQNKLDIANTNTKILLDINSELELKLNAEDFQSSKDSIIISLNNTIDSLNIKMKNVTKVGHIYTKIYDTLIYRDTAFRNIKIDTTLGDKWVSSKLYLDSCRLSIIPCFVSKKDIIFANKKQTVKPKKHWPLWWFQKKHWVSTVNVVEHNPYVKDSSQMFINIIK